jgi:ABC-type multidrug transport system permease subunit
MMASRSFFIQSSEDAQRHIALLAKGLKTVAKIALVGGAGCGVLAILLSHFLVTPHPQPNAVPGVQELSGIAFVAWFMATTMLLFACLYFVSGWGLSHRKPWARYTAAATFVAKVLLCVWLGRGSAGAMIVFLVIASGDFYGLWVLLSKETEQFLSSPKATQASIKPANLVT